MKFIITKSSDLFENYKREVEINSLEDLEKLQNEYATPDDTHYWENPPLIINFNTRKIEIYNYYRE